MQEISLASKDISGKEVHCIYKNYPVSSKMYLTKENRRATIQMNVFGNSSSLPLFYLITKGHGI